MTAAKFTAADLRQFARGTERYYRHLLFRNIVFTEGAKYVADEGEAYWLLAEIGFAQSREDCLAHQPFQVWKLTVNPDQTGVITVEDGNFNQLLTKTLDYTDFPASEITLWFSNNVIYLREEHQPERTGTCHEQDNQRPGTAQNNHATRHAACPSP